ncbi:hypothetical protein GCM10007082_29700 [Oceanisphaera arctica]|nr:hypothetical protein GCM10007082_29700 [Oceanisphaera arctica]
MATCFMSGMAVAEYTKEPRNPVEACFSWLVARKRDAKKQAAELKQCVGWDEARIPTYRASGACEYSAVTPP